MAEPGRLMGNTPSNADLMDKDAEGEYEEEDAGLGHTPQADNHEGNTTDAEGSELDAEGEEIDDDDGEPVGAVKIAAPAEASSEDEDSDADGEAVDLSSDAKSTGDEASERSSSESEAENDWGNESEDGEESGAEPESSHNCTFCGKDEENDPSEEFEEYLTCVSCGDNAHRQCARNANTLSSDDEAKHWRCLACIQDDIRRQQDRSESLTRRRLSSVPRLARDLLPSHRGADPGGHSVFNDLILPDDPLDGSRSLRKRKSSHEEEIHVTRQTRKKRRPSELSRSEAGDGSHRRSYSHAGTAAATDDGSVLDDDDALPSASEHGSTRLRSARSRQTKHKRADKRPLVWTEENPSLGPLSLVVVFHLNNEKVQKILASKPRKRILDPRQEARRERDRERRERNRRAAQQQRADTPELSHYPSIQPHQGVPFYGFADKEMDESKNKPYGGILSEADADTTKTYPTQADRKRFEDARLKAEEDWKQKQAALSTTQEVSKHSKQAGPPSKIKSINFGGYEIDTWHAAPYPEEYSRNRVLYICEFCLKYMNSDYVAWRHKLKCPAKHPPGDEIYRDGKYSFFEVDGRKNPVYCQNLCLLAKLFLGSKTLYYDVEPFLFYVMTENDSYGCHFVGYFSKEKRPSSLNNVSCILVLPIHMRKGYGQFLIEFSYLLTRVEKKTGSPEKPLSDMGLVSYRKYWRLVLCQELLDQKKPISITAISERTGMTPDDIVSALEGLRALVRDPVTKTYALRLDYTYFKQYIEKCNANNNPKINPECLVWTPYVMGRLGQYEDGPALHTVQQREEPDEEAKVDGVAGVSKAEKAAGKNGVPNGNPSGAEDEGESTTPPLPAEESTNGETPQPSTPVANGPNGTVNGSQGAGADLSIPPTRFEVFPPIPGMPNGKRRPGRPFGSRRRTTTPSQNRRASLTLAATAPPARQRFSPSRNGNGKGSPTTNGKRTPSTSLRRTRSRLGESVVNGISSDEVADGGAVKAINGYRNGNKAKGKGLFDAAHDENGHAETDDDVDADGEMDVDAEGEYDEAADVAMANA